QRHRCYGTFRHGIRKPVYQSEEGDNRSNIKDDSALLFLHKPDHSLHSVVDAFDIHIEKTHEIGLRSIFEFPNMRHASTVDKNINLSLQGEYLFDHAIHLLLTGHITGMNAYVIDTFE